MLSAKPNRLALSLVLYSVIALVFASFVQANDALGSVHRREHALLNRMVKRASTPGVVAIGAAAAPDPVTTTDTTSPLRRPTPTVVPDPTPTPVTVIDGPLSPGVSLGVTSLGTTTAAITTTSKTTTSPSTTTTTSKSTTTSTTPTITTTSSAPPTIIPNVFVTRTSTAAAEAPTETPQKQGSISKNDKVLITVLICVGASIVGIIVLWTIFRKWKLNKSDSFDDRMQPIDWQPTASSDDTVHRRHSNASSFHSASGNHGTNYGSTDQNHLAAPQLGPLPDHDFTPGPAQGYGAGYADMARGPSPQPYMQETYGRGPVGAGHGY